MADVLYHRTGLLGPKIELQVAPEGLTLTGRAGRDSVEFAPLADVVDAAVEKRARGSNLTVSFGPSRPAWVLRGLPIATAEWAAALINEERSSLEKRGRPEYTRPVGLDDLAAESSRIAEAHDGRAAVDLVDFLLVQGVMHGASDVHFDPYGDAVVVR